ncbi:MAG: hypothetical protein H6642_16500 [Caldilineaceae bacterium]|nr:hypothetical protein [Caldilineaceae bacterium]
MSQPQTDSSGDLLRSRVVAHDRYQLEFRFDYTLFKQQATRYQIVTYFFLPRSLGVNARLYSTAQFYNDIQSYVRFKTPDFTLQELAVAPTSPLVRIQTLLAQENWVYARDITERLIANFKFLRAILKDSLDNELLKLEEEIKRDGAAQAASAQWQDELLRAVEESRRIVLLYRDLAPQLRRRDVDARVLNSYQLTDEALSLVIEDAYLKMLDTLQSRQLAAASSASRHILAEAVRAELAHRDALHYLTAQKGERDAEAYLFRASALKKFTSSVLYLTTTVESEGYKTEQIMYALAAGISMVFATVVAFYAQQRYGNFTFPLFVALVVGYMFKDRLKDAMRALSHRFLRSFFFDRRTRIRTLDDQHELGYMRERMSFLAEDETPAYVRLARNRQLITRVDQEGQAEEIIRYEKRVLLRGDKVDQLYGDVPPVSAVKDIMRLDVREFLRRMADPTERYLTLSDDGDTVKRIKAPRVYFINVVQVYYRTDSRSPIHTSRTRVALTRRGIHRVEMFA